MEANRSEGWRNSEGIRWIVDYRSYLLQHKLLHKLCIRCSAVARVVGSDTLFQCVCVCVCVCVLKHGVSGGERAAHLLLSVNASIKNKVVFKITATMSSACFQADTKLC